MKPSLALAVTLALLATPAVAQGEETLSLSVSVSWSIKPKE